MSGVVTLGISYTGSTKFNGAWDISVIDINPEGVTTEISADLAECIGGEARQYPVFQVKKNTGSLLMDVITKSTSDTVSMPQEMAKTMKLSARIFLVSKDSARRDNLPIFFDAFPDLTNGESYLIQIMHKTDGLKGKIVRIDAMELQRQIKLARFYPHSMIALPQEETALNEKEKKIYFIYEGMVFGVSGWLSDFAKKARLSPPKNTSPYENVAKEALRQVVKNMQSDAFEKLLKLVEEGDRCRDNARISGLIGEMAKAQPEAIGREGYVTVMRKTLEAFAGDHASQHSGLIEETSAEFARRYMKS